MTQKARWLSIIKSSKIVFETATNRVPSSVNAILYRNIVKDNHDHDLSIQGEVNLQKIQLPEPW